MNMRWRGVLLGLTCVVALTSAGCKKKTQEGEANATAGGAASPGAEVAQEDPRLTPEKLRPVIRELGVEGVVPAQIVVEFAGAFFQDLIIPEWSDATPPPWAGTGPVLKLEPEIGGELAFTSPSTLTFTPGGQLRPATTYTVTLESVPTKDGVLTAPADGSWTYQFTTPEFGFNRLSVYNFEAEKSRAQLDLVFTNDVRAEEVLRRATWKVKGKPLPRVRLEATERPYVVRAILQSPELQSGAEVELALAPGVPYPGDPTLVAGKGKGTVTLMAGKPIEILKVARRESGTGHYLEVVCNDKAANGSERYYWDNVDYDSYYVSSRCVLTEASAAEYIRFDPAVKFYTAPSSAGFRIFGDFKRGTYSMTIEAGARSVDEGVLSSTYETSFSVPARSPRVDFASKGRYLPRDAWRNLAISHLNLDKVELSVRNVPPENLIFWMSGGSELADERTSNLILKKDIALKAEPDQLATSFIDVGTLLPDAGDGIYQLDLRAGDVQASARLLLTQLNLIAKRSSPSPGDPYAREVYVWATDMHTTEPQAGVEVRLVRPSGRTLATCTTTASGCRLEAPAGDVDTTEPFAIVARKGRDVTYLKFSELKTDLGDMAVSGEPYLSEKAYRAAIHSDRGVYRPGETAHIAVILRDRDHVAPKEAMPVTLDLVDPRENTARTVNTTANTAGWVVSDFSFDDFATTGRWRVDVKVGDKVVGSYGFNVEEFVPERMKVEAKAAGAGYSTSERVPVEVGARYLFGGSAEGSAVELTCQLGPSEFKPAENKQYTYGVWRGEDESPAPISLGVVAGEIAVDGVARMECPGLEQGGSFEGAASLSARVAVFEAGSGRTTTTTMEVPMHPEKFYVGLQANVESFEVGKPFTVQGVVVDWNGKRVGTVKDVSVEFKKMDAEYDWGWDDSEGTHTYERHLRPVPDGTTRAAVTDGQFKIDVTPREYSAAYLVRVRAGKARTDLLLEGTGGWWWGGFESRIDQTPRPMKPTSLNVVLPDSGKVGERITASFNAPYAGRALMTVETHRVLSSEWIVVKPGPNTWSFTPSEFAPNLYVSAFLVKDPHLESKEAFMPDRAFGVAGIKLEPVNYSLGVTLDLPREVRSNSDLTVGVNVTPSEGPTFVTVAAVDEGILSLTRFKDPDPRTTVFARRSLGVLTYETVGWALHVQPGGPSRSTGGDEGGDPGRVQSVKPVALWSGLVEVPASGKASITFKVPQYRGSLRVMAVAASGKRMGNAAASVPVRDPLVLLTTLPRFLIKGDVVDVPVFVTNMTGAAQQVKVKLTAEDLKVRGLDAVLDPVPAIQFVGGKEGTLNLAAGASGTSVFQIMANRAFGAATLKVVASAGKFESAEALDVPFMDRAAPVRQIQKIELKSGTTDLKPYLTGWVPTTERSTFWVTGNPYGESFDHLSYLVRYPYGCIEQTTSSTRPLLFVSNLLYNVDPTVIDPAKVEAMVMSGIDRLRSMQLPEGGFGYWPGETHVTWWGTAYATHLLLDAKKLKYPVPGAMVDDAVDFIESTLSNEGALDRDVGWGSARDSEPYLHYVLALAGKGRKARIQKLIDGWQRRTDSTESDEQLYLLKAALYLSGDRRYEKDLRAPDVSPIKVDRHNSWSYYSDQRRRGLTLSTFHDLFGNAPEGEALARLVAGSLGRNSGYYTTQELVWSVTGLGKWVAGANSTFSEPSLTANGKKREPQAQSPGAKVNDRTWSLARASELRDVSVSVADAGKGKLYLILASEGVKEGYQPPFGGEGLKVERRYVSFDGQELDLASGGLKLGDMVFVELTLTNTWGPSIQNIALVDRFPAGWEVENPRLGRGMSVDWIDFDALWEAESMNIRDDRVEVFGRLNYQQSVKVVYTVRVTSSGTFALPPVEAGAMYDPSHWARSPGGTVTVEGPWDDYRL